MLIRKYLKNKSWTNATMRDIFLNFMNPTEEFTPYHFAPFLCVPMKREV